MSTGSSSTQSQALSTHHAQIDPEKRQDAQAGLLRILLIGEELRVEALRALLSVQEDMKVLSPLSVLVHVQDVVSRLTETHQRRRYGLGQPC